MLFQDIEVGQQVLPCSTERPPSILLEQLLAKEPMEPAASQPEQLPSAQPAAKAASPSASASHAASHPAEQHSVAAGATPQLSTMEVLTLLFPKEQSLPAVADAAVPVFKGSPASAIAAAAAAATAAAPDTAAADSATAEKAAAIGAAPSSAATTSLAEAAADTAADAIAPAATASACDVSVPAEAAVTALHAAADAAASAAVDIAYENAGKPLAQHLMLQLHIYWNINTLPVVTITMHCSLPDHYQMPCDMRTCPAVQANGLHKAWLHCRSCCDCYRLATCA